MSRRPFSDWYLGTLKFQDALPGGDFRVEDALVPEAELDAGLYLEEAHEALSRLFNKSHKRERQWRGGRRKDIWH